MKNQSTYCSPFIDTLVSLTSWQRKLLTTSVATLFLGIAANISIPAYPVPFTLQSLAVLLVGAFLGRKLAALSLMQYLFVGALGLPVFANGSGGLAALMSPSAGYLYGYIFAAYVAGYAAERGYDRKLLSGIITFAIAHQILFIFGVVYLKFYFQISLFKAFEMGYLPFVGIDALKFIIATLIMFSLWRQSAKK